MKYNRHAGQVHTEVGENINAILQLGYVIIYSDGCCPNNGSGGPGSAAAIILRADTEPQTVTEFLPAPATNQRAEIVGACIGLESLPAGQRVFIISDSQYVIQTGLGLWRKKTNHEYWTRLDRACAPHLVRFEWVKGHSGDKYNDMADEAADQCLRARGISTEDRWARSRSTGREWIEAEMRDRR